MTSEAIVLLIVLGILVLSALIYVYNFLYDLEHEAYCRQRIIEIDDQFEHDIDQELPTEYVYYYANIDEIRIYTFKWDHISEYLGEL